MKTKIIIALTAILAILGAILKFVITRLGDKSKRVDELNLAAKIIKVKVERDIKVATFNAKQAATVKPLSKEVELDKVDSKRVGDVTKSNNIFTAVTK